MFGKVPNHLFYCSLACFTTDSECQLTIIQAQQAYNADPVFYSDPMPSHPNVISQTTVEDATNTTQDSLVYNNSTFTTTSTDIHSSDRVHDTQDNLEQDTFYEHPTGYYSAALSPATIDPHVLDPQAGHMDSLPHTNIYDPAYGLAASLIAHVSESQDNTPGKVNHVTQAVVQHPAKLLPVATMKTTGRIVRASTLHFHQLVTDKHFQIDDELHVPLEVIRRADGSREPARDVVAVMMVSLPLFCSSFSQPTHHIVFSFPCCMLMWLT